MSRQCDFSLPVLFLIILMGCRKHVPEIPQADLSEAFPEVAKFIKSKADAVAQAPGSANAWGSYAMALDAHEYRRVAILAYNEARRLEPDELKWSYLLSQQVKLADAQAALKLLLSIQSKTHADLVAYRIGELAEEVDQPELAIASYRRALQASPLHPNARHRLASVLLRQGNFTAAMKELELIQENYRETAVLRAQIRFLQGQTEEAKILETKARSLPELLPRLHDPLTKSLAEYRRDPLYKAMQAMESLRQGRPWAIQILHDLVEDHPDLVQIRLLYAEALLQQRDFETADAILGEGLKRSPDNALLLALWGSSDIAQRRWAEAEAHFKRAIAVKPDYIGAHADLGYVLEQQGKIASAIEQYELVLKMKPADEQIARRLDSLRQRTP